MGSYEKAQYFNNIRPKTCWYVQFPLLYDNSSTEPRLIGQCLFWEKLQNGLSILSRVAKDWQFVG
jgi:hypothetical protein